MKKQLAIVSSALTLLVSGCNSDSQRQQEPVVQRSIQSRVVDYTTHDPKLEPTLNVGGFLEVRTREGGAVVLQSQVDKQRRAAEEQRAANAEHATVIVTPNDSK